MHASCSASLSDSGVKDGDLIVLERAGAQNQGHPANGMAGGCARAGLALTSPHGHPI